MIPPILIWNVCVCVGGGGVVSLGKLNKLVKQWQPKLVEILELFIPFSRINKVYEIKFTS